MNTMTAAVIVVTLAVLCLIGALACLFMLGRVHYPGVPRVGFGETLEIVRGDTVVARVTLTSLTRDQRGTTAVFEDEGRYMAARRLR